MSELHDLPDPTDGSERPDRPSTGRRRWLSSAVAGIVPLVMSPFGLLTPDEAVAAQPAINTLKNSFLGGRTDTAINGYDTVAYFTQGKPVKGLEAYTVTWMGAVWRFSSQAHLDLFRARPEQYAPQYGGYCAYGVAKGNLVKVEPDQFTVRDGKLYLNYDADIQARWLKDPAGFIRDADSRFPALLK